MPVPRETPGRCRLGASLAQAVSAADVDQHAKSSPESLTGAGCVPDAAAPATPLSTGARRGFPPPRSFIDATAEGPGERSYRMLA